jgi:hypothetical protein
MSTITLLQQFKSQNKTNINRKKVLRQLPFNVFFFSSTLRGEFAYLHVYTFCTIHASPLKRSPTTLLSLSEAFQAECKRKMKRQIIALEN